MMAWRDALERAAGRVLVQTGADRAFDDFQAWLKRLPISRKVMFAILAGTVSTLIIGAVALVGFEIGSYRRQTLRDLTALANIVGTSSAGALVFEDAQTSMEMLSRLSEDPAITAARLYAENGRPLATYERPGEAPGKIPDNPGQPGYRFVRGRIALDHPVYHRGDHVGHLYLEYDLTQVRARLVGYLSIVSLAILLLAGLSFVISSVLQRFVSAPILSLAQAARRITERNDYSVRADGGFEQDEVGALTRAFNQMLDAIEVRERELEASRQSLTLAQTAGRIGSFDWSSETNITVWSREMEALYGMPPGSYDGTHEAWVSRIHPDDLETVNQANERAKSGSGDLSIEFRIVWPDGSIHWLVSRARYMFDADGKLRRVVGVNIDISDRKAAEARLIDQAEELWRSNRELEQFAYVSSHDLQEPLRKVASFAQLLASKYRGKLGEEADRYVENITDGVSRMRDLIQDLLAYSRLSRQIPPAEPVALEQLLRRLIEDLEPLITETQAKIVVDKMPVIEARPSQMQQVFQNLVSNALKFHGEKPPTVKISAKRLENEHLFSVKDNGIGIEPRYASQIFKVFQRLHPRGRYPGTGIGLAICKKIVEQHGGRIWVESELGKGATFYFTMPLVQTELVSSGEGRGGEAEPV